MRKYFSFIFCDDYSYVLIRFSDIKSLVIINYKELKMLTPAFELNQDDDFLMVHIRVPYAKVSDIEVHHEDNDFMFYSKPYYLRLNLPGKVLYSEEPIVKYDIDQKTVTVKAPKATQGEVFQGLDLMTSLLAPRKPKIQTAPLIEVIDGVDNEENDEELDWFIDQTPLENDFLNLSIDGQQCGFANSHPFSVFNLQEEVTEIFDVKDPQNKSPKARKEERMLMESKQFSEDHYLADLYNDDEIKYFLRHRPEWDDLCDKLLSDSAAQSPDEEIHFSLKEKEKLRQLPSREYLLDKSQVKMIMLGLVDIIFAYAYNKRTTEGENTVESAWTINKLSATLSWLETFSSVQEVSVACIRRSLCYPLYRHFELSLTILDDVRKIFLLGRKSVIKCLLEIHELFSSSEPRYILNDLYITHYCVWMQSRRCSSRKLTSLADTIGKILLTKGDIGLNLVDIETFAEIAWRTYGSSHNLVSNKLNNTKSGTSELSEASQLIREECSKAEALLRSDSLQKKDSEIEGDITSSGNGDLLSEYESCSTCTSDSSYSSSNTFDSTETDSEDSSSTDSDDTASSADSELDSHSHLLRKANSERLR